MNSSNKFSSILFIISVSASIFLRISIKSKYQTAQLSRPDMLFLKYFGLEEEEGKHVKLGNDKVEVVRCRI